MHSIKFKNGEFEFFETNKELKRFLFLLKEQKRDPDFEIYIDTNLTLKLSDYTSILKMRDPQIEIPPEIKTIEDLIEFFDIISFYRKIRELSY